MRENSDYSQFKITICGIDELPEHSAAKVTHVLSILDPTTPEPEAFGAYGEHARLELRFHDVIEPVVPGFDSPEAHHIETLLTFGEELRNAPADAHVLVHCHMGISRSTAAAILLLAQANPGRPATEIVAEIVKVRSKAWPNLLMIEIGDEMLGFDGTLVDAVRARHRRMALALPEVADFMRDNGRVRELD